jgi:hypothetical protein
MKKFLRMEIRFDFGLAEALDIQHKTCLVSRFPLYHPAPEITPFRVSPMHLGAKQFLN